MLNNTGQIDFEKERKKDSFSSWPKGFYKSSCSYKIGHYGAQRFPKLLQFDKHNFCELIIKQPLNFNIFQWPHSFVVIVILHGLIKYGKENRFAEDSNAGWFRMVLWGRALNTNE